MNSVLNQIIKMNRIIYPFKKQSSQWNPLKLLRFNNSSLAGSSIVKTKIDYFDSKADSWWDSSLKGSMSQLFILDPYRIKFVCDQLRQNPSINLAANDKPLTGLKILDVGCGVGVICEKLATMGAEMTGLDPAESLIEAATRHASLNPKISPRLEYLTSTPEVHAMSFSEKYDAALVFFVLEHVKNRQNFIDSCLHLLKPNGSLIMIQTNRTFANRFLLCYWNPYILRLYDRNLIKYHQLMNTSELLQILCAGDCQLMDIRGLRFEFIGRGACFTNSYQYFNMIHVVKRTA